MGSADLGALRIDRSRPPERGFPWWVAIGVVALVAVGALVAFRSGLVGAKPAVVMLALVEGAGSTGAGGSAGGVEVLTANGYVVPRKKASVSSEVGGRLAALYVTEGDTATAGQVLGVLRNDDFRSAIAGNEARLAQTRAALTEARAALSLAQTDHKRAKEMFDRQLTAQSAYDAAKSTLDMAAARVEVATAAIGSADADLKQSRELLEKTFIRAPFDGTILRKEAEVGEIVSPQPSSGGQTRGAIVTMADLKSCEMEVDVNETYVSRVSTGQPAEVELDAYTGVRFPARVRQVVPTADRQKATVQVKVEFAQSDPRILPEMGGKVYFLKPARPSEATDAAPASGEVLVPKSAVRDMDGRSTVFVVVNGRAVARPVQISGPAGDKLRIGAGLAAGEQVIVSGGDALKDGARVKVGA